MSQNKEKNNSNFDLQNQIFSMLKGVGVIEENEFEFKENINDIKENLFGDDDFSIPEFEDAETNHNTTISNYGNFLRTQNEKSLTTKIDNMIFNNYNQIFRRGKKFQTQNYNSNYSFNPIDNCNVQTPNNCLFNSINSFDNLNNLNNFSQNNNNLNFTIQNQLNNNILNYYNMNSNSPLTTTPFGMEIPIRAFNFNTKINNTNNINYNILNLRNNLGKNIKHEKSSFYHQTKKEKCDKKHNLIINENISRELEMLLIQNGFFNHNVYKILQGKFIPLMKIQQSSRILQYYLDNTPSEIIHLIFIEIKNELEDLLFDIYANYFCLKLFYFLNEDDRIIFLKIISKNLDNLSINKISTYPIQCIIEKLNNEKEQEIIFNGIINNLMKLCIDVYGTHVIEKIFSSFFNYEKYLIYISNFILDNFIYLVNNSNGLCVVKKEIIIEYKIKNNNFEKLKKLLVENSLILVQNPFGNYALQTAIDNWKLEDLKELISTFKGKCVILSIQKYSSNVIERCIEKSEEFLYNFIIEISNDDNSIGLLMKNNYGNYVIQTALKALKNNKNVKNILINMMNSNLIILNDKKLINKWKSIISNNCTN